MNTRGLLAVAVTALALAALFAALWLLPSTPVATRPAPVAHEVPHPAPAPPPADPAPAERGALPDLSALGGHGPDPALHREFATPEEAEAFVTRNVLELFAVVTPEIDPASITAACTADGRHCTFEGPWPGDDLLRRWLQAIAAGETGPADLEGVTFSTLRPERRDDTRVFVLEAHAP